MSQLIRVLALMEASTVTGPAKNLLRFCCLARERSQGRCRVSIVTFVRTSDPHALPENAFILAAREAGVEIEVIRERRRFDPRVFSQLKEIFERHPTDIVQTHGIKSHFLARRVRGNARWLAYHHGYTSEDLKMRLYNQLNPLLLPAADRVVTVCEAFAAQLVKAGVRRERIHVLPNSIESGGASAKPEAPGAMPMLLSIGRLSREKGHRDLIEAFRRIRQQRPEMPLQLILIGDGLERLRLAQQAEAAGVRDSVNMPGHLPNPFPYYKRASVFILPSHSEGSPNVLLEAIAEGAPVVACAVGGVPEMVKHEESALLVPPGDPGALAEAILRVLDHPELAQTLRQNAARTLRERHMPETYCDSLLNVYAELLDKSVME